MNLENRMPLRRTLIPLMLLAALAAAASCADPSPMGVPAFQRGGKWSQQPTKSVGLVACAQTYDSVTQVIGPAGGLIAVGNHFLWVDTMALSDTVSITAVAPADTLRWVRFSPDGLQFRTNGAGWSALLFTSFKDCGLPTTDTLDRSSHRLAARHSLPGPTRLDVDQGQEERVESGRSVCRRGAAPLLSIRRRVV